MDVFTSNHRKKELSKDTEYPKTYRLFHCSNSQIRLYIINSTTLKEKYSPNAGIIIYPQRIQESEFIMNSVRLVDE